MSTHHGGAPDEVIGAALSLARDGVDAITIAGLTAASGVSNGSIYHHFGNRDGVLAAAVDRVFGQAMEAARPALEQPDLRGAITGFVHRYLEWVATHWAEALVLYHGPLELQRGSVSSAKVDAFAPVAASIADRMATGEMRSMDLSLVDPIAFGPVHETCRRWLANRDSFDLIELSEELGQAVAAILISR